MKNADFVMPPATLASVWIMPPCLVLALLLAPLAQAQTAAPPAGTSCDASQDKLLQATAAVHKKQRNIGLAALIFRDGMPVFSAYEGLADLEHDVPVDARTRFGIGSITKLFTAITVLKLHGTGQLDLDAPVQKYVATFPSKPEGEITVRMLVTHHSGIPHPQAVRTPELFATHYDTALEALEVFQDEPLAFPPGSQQAYSSSNYNLLAAIIEAVSAQAFTEFVQKEIFNPLGLSSTSFDNILRPLPHRSRRYSYYHPWTYDESQELFLVPLWDYSFNTGGGNIISTAADLARFGTALITPGLLPEGELDLLYSEEWFGQRDEEGHRFIHVSGANPGVQAGMDIYPDDEIATAVLSNTWGIGSRSGEMAMLAQHLAQMCADD